MLDYHHNSLRICSRIGFVRNTRRLLATIGLTLSLCVFANAYTVVLRDGRRIEIPDKFQVTATSLTYEVRTGILVTIQMTSIDVASTNSANGFPAETVLRLSGQEPGSNFRSAGARSTSRTIRTLTNLDLEATRLKRIESEAAYEVRRKELGLPSREESDKQRQEESARAKEILASSENEQAEAEKYWRARATELRNEIYVLDTEIDYLRSRVGTYYDSTFSGIVTYGGPSLFSYSQRGVGGAPIGNQGGAIRTQGARQNSGTVGVAQLPASGGSRFNGAYSNGTYGYGQRFNNCRFGPCAQSYGLFFQNYYSSYDTSALIQRLGELETTRSGMGARWQLLEDDARRAGAQPGWLRP